MKHSRNQLVVLSVLITFMVNPAVAQEGGGGGGGESPAESSVSSSSSKKSKAAPEAVESNPVVTVVRAGIDLTTAKSMGIAGVKKVAKAGGTFSNLRHVSKAIGTGSVDHTHVIAAVDAGLTGGGDGADLHFLKAAGHIKTGKLELTELSDLKNAIDAKIDIDKIFKDGGHGGIKAVKKLVDFGFTGDHLEHLDASQLSSFVDAGTLLSVDNAQAAKGHLADGKLSLAKLIEHGVENVTKAVANNYTLDDLNTKSATDLTTTLGHIDAGLSKEQADAAHSSGVSAETTQSLLTAGIPTDLISSVAALNLSSSDLTKLSSNLSKGVLYTTNTSKGISVVYDALAAGITTPNIESFEASKLSNLTSLIGYSLSFAQAEVAHGMGISTQAGADQIKTADTAGYSLAEIQVFSLDRLSKVTSLIGFGLSKDQVEVAYSIGITTQAGADQIKTAVAAGYTLAEIQSLSLTKLADTIALINSGLSKDDANSAISSGISSAGAALLSQLHSSTQNTALKDAITNVLADAAYTAPTHQAALTSAASVADSILKDISIRSAADFPTAINVASFAGNGYNTELVKLLVKYGAIGSKGSELATAAINGFSTTSSTSSNLSGLLSASSSDYLSLLSTLTGNTDLGDPDGDNDNFMKSTVLDVKLDKINLIPGANISLGAKGSTSTVDVTPMLTKSTSTADRKVLVIGAAKDMTIAGDVTFTNSNDVEDHALAIGAADDFYLRSEYAPANAADYDNPAPINVKYTGSNLGLGSEDTMRLVNVNIETGGNLALSSLNELHIGLSDVHSSTFSVGTGGKNSDPDNVYLVANNLIQVNGLNFSGRLDDVYMEAITINLKDVAFPSTADVMLRSRDGTLHFNTFNNRVVGGVNLTDVSHGGINLSPAHFDNGPAGHIDSAITLPNGTSAIKIRKQ